MNPVSLWVHAPSSAALPSQVAERTNRLACFMLLISGVSNNLDISDPIPVSMSLEKSLTFYALEYIQWRPIWFFVVMLTNYANKFQRFKVIQRSIKWQTH
jgi:hypothetical protein